MIPADAADLIDDLVESINASLSLLCFWTGMGRDYRYRVQYHQERYTIWEDTLRYGIVQRSEHKITLPPSQIISKLLHQDRLFSKLIWDELDNVVQER